MPVFRSCFSIAVLFFSLFVLNVPTFFRFTEPSSTLLSVLWHTPIGCDFSGFFVELLGVIVALDPHVNLRLDIGFCSPSMVAQLSPNEGAVLSRIQVLNQSSTIFPWIIASDTMHCSCLQQRPNLLDVNALVLHSQPRTFKNLVRKPRPCIVVGRCMTESSLLPASDATAVTLVDEIWVPSAWHREVFIQAGVRLSARNTGCCS